MLWLQKKKLMHVCIWLINKKGIQCLKPFIKKGEFWSLAKLMLEYLELTRLIINRECNIACRHMQSCINIERHIHVSTQDDPRNFDRKYSTIFHKGKIHRPRKVTNNIWRPIHMACSKIRPCTNYVNSSLFFLSI